MPQQVRPLEMEGSGPRQTRHVVSQRQDNFLNLERERDQDKRREGSVNTSHTSRSRSKGKGHASQKRRRSRTPPSETFSYEKEQPHKCGHKSPSYQGLANDAMSKALNRICQSPFTHRIEGSKLPQRFHQPTFTIYNGRTDPVEHVSQFN